MNAQRSLLCRVGVILFTLISCGQPASAERTDRTVIVVLIDGFAPSMVEAAETPHLDRIGREGSSSHHLAPVFPTMSMVNHTSFATGCWPEHHGIMSNIFVDPERGRFESSSDADWRTGCLSMWEIAESQNISAAALAITGSHSSASGALATHTLPDVAWEQRPSDKERTQSAIDLLNMVGPARPGLIVLYLTGPDDTAHNNGIAAPETLAAAREADTRVGELINVIDALPEDREVSLLIAADHGMANVSPLINVTKIMNKHRIRGQQASDGAAAFLYLDDPADIDAAYERLSTYSEFETFRRGEHPAWSHLGNSRRAGDLMLVTRPPFWMAGAEIFPTWSKLLGITHIWKDVFVPPAGSGLKATHGFVPSHPEMQSIFYAWGSGIKAGYNIEALDMIDIAPSALHLLGITLPQSIDGKVIEEMLAAN